MFPNLLSPNQYMPHGQCYLWQTNLIWLHSVSDLLIAIAYFSMSAMLIYFAYKRRDVPFLRVLILFSAFIIFCGMGHLLDIWTLWHPAYWISGVEKAITAMVSCYTASELVELMPQFFSLKTPEQLEAINQELQSQVRERKQAEANLRKLTEELEIRVQQRTILLEDANRSLHREIRDKIAAQKALQASEEKWRAILENMPVMLDAFDGEGNLIVWNHECERVTGYSAEEIIGNPQAMELFYPDASYRQKMMVLWSERGNNYRNWQWQLMSKEGQVKTIAWSNISDVYPVSGWASWGIGIDMSNHHRAKLALREAKEVADTANRAKSDFLASMSHELRTPLNAILGFSQLMAGDKSIGKQNHKYLSTINRAGENLLTLINDILEVSKIEAGKVVLQTESFDLFNFLDNLKQMFSLKAKAKSLKLIFERESTTPRYIKADANKLHQILVNLLNNGIKFTERGKVTLRVSRKSPNILTFAVEDTGIGITQEDVETIFKPFEQGQKRLQYQQGTGLGLTITQQFVELMGGKLVLDTIPGKGSSFSFTLPITLTSANEVNIHQPEEEVIGIAPNQSPYRILIVDDHDDGRMLTVNLLTSLGFEVREATNGQEGVKLWESWQPQLILMDMRMPLMNGYEAAKKIRSQENQTQVNERSPVTIIALTASVFKEEQVKILNSGCNDIIHKPSPKQLLLQKISQHLGVNYIHKQPTKKAITQEKTSSPLDELQSKISLMPKQWLQQMHQAAISGDDILANELVNQVSPEYESLKNGLRDLVEDFRLGEISLLIKQQL